MKPWDQCQCCGKCTDSCDEQDVSAVLSEFAHVNKQFQKLVIHFFSVDVINQLSNFHGDI